MKSEWETAAEKYAWDVNYCWAADCDAIEYAERMGKYRGRSVTWEKQWHSECNSTWARSRNKRWPPFSWDVSRSDLSFADWERDHLNSQWSEFTAGLPGVFWKNGRNDEVGHAKSQQALMIYALAFNDSFRSSVDKELLAIIRGTFSGRITPGVGPELD